MENNRQALDDIDNKILDVFTWMDETYERTKKSYDTEKTIHELFEEQVKKCPEKTAIIYQNKSITYKELNRKSNQLARKLRQYGIKRNMIVGLMVQRSIEMIIGILGIIKAGGCYLPIDPKFPMTRIQYMIHESNVNLIITQHELSDNFIFDGTLMYIDDDFLYSGEDSDLDNVNNSSDLIYVIYTSGSSGKPKGVMIKHQSVHNFILGMVDVIDFHSDKSILCLTTISFDIFVLETLLPLTIGMQIMIADPRKVSTDLLNHQPDMLQTTPSTMKLMLNDPSNLGLIARLSEIMLGGEPLPRHLLSELRRLTKATIFNMYGPTETTIWSTVKKILSEDDITIGLPIANTQLCIVDERGIPVSLGSAGELCISGDGLASGYLHRSDLTSERFRNHPYYPAMKMYKTGDRVRLLKNGEIEYLGRIDQQVKIRGFRIELAEIEDCLQEHYLIKECVVTAKENEMGESYLVAYYVADNELTKMNLIFHLSESLPEYMIPSYFVRLQQIPLTPNGKIDRLSLPEPDMKRPNLDTDYLAPNTDEESAIAAIWGKVLKLDLVGVNDNFFELGGNSILLSRMYVELEEHFKMKLQISDIFSYPTVSKLARYLAEQKSKYRSISEKIIDQELQKKLSYIADVCRMNISYLLAAAFGFLLSEELRQEKLRIIAYLNGDSSMSILNFNFDDITQFDEVYKQIEREVLNAKGMNLHPNTKSDHSTTNEGSMLFAYDSEQEVQKYSDISLLVTQEDSSFHLKMVFNNKKFKQNIMTHWLAKYKKLVTIIIGELTTVNGEMK
ncbi:non-ribosomal peptide synthetase [Brevibacillus sp. SAFN-007a]|uniref:non-ribosomal peptide synthetase n=1 Tax=Brevibacillus sp. SAFN-007a TaxID=3436862 RepID=UPI003F8083F0